MHGKSIGSRTIEAADECSPMCVVPGSSAVAGASRCGGPARSQCFSRARGSDLVPNASRAARDATMRTIPIQISTPHPADPEQCKDSVNGPRRSRGPPGEDRGLSSDGRRASAGICTAECSTHRVGARAILRREAVCPLARTCRLSSSTMAGFCGGQRRCRVRGACRWE